MPTTNPAIRTQTHVQQTPTSTGVIQAQTTPTRTNRQPLPGTEEGRRTPEAAHTPNPNPKAGEPRAGHALNPNTRATQQYETQCP